MTCLNEQYTGYYDLWHTVTIVFCFCQLLVKPICSYKLHQCINFGSIITLLPSGHGKSAMILVRKSKLLCEMTLDLKSVQLETASLCLLPRVYPWPPFWPLYGLYYLKRQMKQILLFCVISCYSSDYWVLIKCKQIIYCKWLHVFTKFTNCYWFLWMTKCRYTVFIPYLIHSLLSSSSCSHCRNLSPWPLWILATWLRMENHFCWTTSPSPQLLAAHQYMWLLIDLAHLPTTSHPFLFPAASNFLYTPVLKKKISF